VTSIRTRLFVILVLATGLIWLCAVVWIYVNTRHEVERALDTRLMEAARMVSSLVTRGEAVVGATVEPPILDRTTGYERQLSCQIWSLDGRLLGLSGGAPSVELSAHASGFSETVIDGQVWRVYAIADEARGVRVLVGDRLTVREHLVGDMIVGLLLPAAPILPALAILIWASVGRGLRPLRSMTAALERRDANDLSPIGDENAPAEIRPMIEALNTLFGRVAEARAHERGFTAFAAHELRTPLAGLKTQVQVALAARETAARDSALRQTLVAVDRTTRLVEQLLSMSRLDVYATAAEQEWIDVGAALESLTQSLRPAERPVTVDVTPDARTAFVLMNAELFHLAVKNLFENALQHSPDGGTVTWSVRTTGAAAILAVQDDGPGIPEDELQLVRRRFFRGRHKSAVGNGLGLAIVDLALQRAGAELRLRNTENGTGLVAEIVLGRERVSSGPRGRV